MGAAELAVVVPRLKREDCKRTKHDSHFSKWQVLIGPSDWENYSLGKEGAARYRVHNLPATSGPGLYELGIAVSRTGSGREAGKLDPDGIVVVYLGQADNVRTRLQHYGRSGAHLGCSRTSGPGLFEDIFSRGYTVMFRWAPMTDKAYAERTEAQLLDKFDYAWNKGSNGARRPDDISKKLAKVASSTTRFRYIMKKLLPFIPKEGIEIKSSKLLSPGNKFIIYPDEESYNFLPQVFKFSKSQPRLVLDRQGASEDNTSICGVALDDGSICRKPPVEGRKRCAEHRGMKINESITKLNTEVKSQFGGYTTPESNIPGDTECDGHRAWNFGFGEVKLPLNAEKCPVSEGFTPICGVTLDDGSACRRPPVQGRKRCDEHKGKKIYGSNSKMMVTERMSRYVQDVILDSSSRTTFSYGENFSEICKPRKVQSRVISERSAVVKVSDSICGVELGDGYVCMRQPVTGRVRCEEHKGMRINGVISKLAAKHKSKVSDMG